MILSLKLLIVWLNSFFRKNRPQFWRLRAKTGKLKLIFKQTWSSFFYLSGSTFFKLINISFKYRQIFLKLIIQCFHTRIKLIFNRKYHFNWPRLTTETDNNNRFLLLNNFPKITHFSGLRSPRPWSSSRWCTPSPEAGMSPSSRGCFTPSTESFCSQRNSKRWK